jgi:hypothetical protein
MTKCISIIALILVGIVFYGGIVTDNSGAIIFLDHCGSLSFDSNGYSANSYVIFSAPVYMRMESGNLYKLVEDSTNGTLVWQPATEPPDCGPGLRSFVP